MSANDWPRYDPDRSYDWNYDQAPDPVAGLEVPQVPGKWDFCGLPVASPLGVAAGPLLNGRWCLYYASLGFDVVTYKTVRSRSRDCYPLPNLMPVACGSLFGGEQSVPASRHMQGSWAVSFGMPSKEPDVWRADVERTRRELPAGKLLSVSVVASVQQGWTIDDLAQDYAQCARWAVDSGADCIETNFSCPNVSTCDGQLYQQPADAAVVAQVVRAAIGRTTPFIVKVGHLDSRQAAGELLEAVAPHVDALSMTNSIAVTVHDTEGHALFDGQKRGICGRATLDASLAQTRIVRQLVQQRGDSLQLIGVGGAASADDVRQYLAAGAHAVHLATAAMTQPNVALNIRRQWPVE
jgi:dihydroorotate dehydrogenase (NAD+) catalytic subunit